MTTTTQTALTRNDMVYDALDNRYYRVARVEADGMVVLMTVDCTRELPDYRHVAHLRRV